MPGRALQPLIDIGEVGGNVLEPPSLDPAAAARATAASCSSLHAPQSAGSHSHFPCILFLHQRQCCLWLQASCDRLFPRAFGGSSSACGWLDRRCRRWAKIISPCHDAPREAIGGDMVLFVCVLIGVQAWQSGKKRNQKLQFLCTGDQNTAN